MDGKRHLGSEKGYLFDKIYDERVASLGDGDEVVLTRSSISF